MFDNNNIPISLYIHVPWCIRKCPYCDFNSHPVRNEIPVQAYLTQLIADFRSKLPMIQARSLHSIFIGGGTPSLFPPEAYESLFNSIQKEWEFPKQLEITLEANPGTVLEKHLMGYQQIGINRLSLGIQSFQDDKLKRLGRIHNAEAAIAAVEAVKKAGFDNFNLDLMFGLPEQSQEDALSDLKKAISLNPTHLSWYQLTLEPNTLFYKYPPSLPNSDAIWAMQLKGQALLSQNNYQQYEVSAYSQNNQMCQHNMNYWEFGDYLGIGAGAHGKITDMKTREIKRHCNVKHPKHYLDPNKNKIEKIEKISSHDIAFEFLLNALRLEKAIPIDLFEQRTGLSIKCIEDKLTQATHQNFINIDNKTINVTPLGRRFLNNLLEIFLV